MNLEVLAKNCKYVTLSHKSLLYCRTIKWWTDWVQSSFQTTGTTGTS